MAKWISVNVKGLEHRHYEEIWDHASKLRSMMSDESLSYPVPKDGWTCFHCGLRFTTVASASAHFGENPRVDVAACKKN